MNIHESLYRQGWSRPQEGRVIAGVCAGVARRLGITPWGARVLVLVLLVALPGSPLILYPVLWVLMPADRYVPAGPVVTPPTAV